MLAAINRINHQYVLAAFALMIGCNVGTVSYGAEPTLTEVLSRLEQTERELIETRSKLDLLETRDAEREQQQAELINRLPATEQEEVIIPVSSSWIVHTDQGSPETELQAQIQQLGAGIEELGEGMQQMKTGVEELGKALRVTTVDEDIKIGIFGWARGEAVFTDQTTALLAAPFLAVPDFPAADQDNIRVHGRSTGIGAGIQGPCVCGYESGGLVLIYFFGNSVLSNSVGVFVAQAYGELKNDHSRIAFGIQSDIIGPRNPTVVNWGMYAAGGNTGFLRGQLRYERYFYPRCDQQWTITMGISDPAPTNLAAALPEVGIAGSNGWPNVEGRIALGLGCQYKDGMEVRRPLEIGLSGMVGEIRTNRPAALQFPPPAIPQQLLTSYHDDTWYAGVDMRWAVNDCFGFQGELFSGKGLGTYSGGVLQTINGAIPHRTVRSKGGWGEVYWYWTPCLHSHVGYGIDDPRDADVVGSAGGRTRNEVVFANLMWDVTKNFQVAFEYSNWDTDYIVLPDAEANVYHGRVQLSF